MKSYLHFLLLPLFLFVLFLAGAARDPVQATAVPPEPATEEAAAVGPVPAGKLSRPIPEISRSVRNDK